jgi:hypothetical protein
MRAKLPYPKEETHIHWNDTQLDGRLNTADYEVDLGSVIPSALESADVPDIMALIWPRRVLFCQARDNQAPGVEALASRFRRVVGSAGKNWITLDPGRPLDGRLLLEWLREEDKR